MAKRRKATEGRPSNEEKLSQRIDSVSNDPNERKAADQAAKITGSNRQYVADAKKIKAQDPELFEQVKTGKKTIPEAKRVQVLVLKRHNPAIG